MFGTPPEPGDDREGMARALAAVLPEHERQVRAKVAAEIEANPTHECSGAVAACARIARGETR
jgi:hypothetical protein